MLKAASAAGIVWASPVLQSVTAHAAGTCRNVQFNAAFSSEGTTDPATDGLPLCVSVPSCGLAGVSSSLCVCNAFAAGSPALSPPGSWTGLEYTAPTGCTILAANARLIRTVGSGCPAKFRCVTTGISISSDGKKVTFPPPSPPGATYWKFRMIMCCSA